MRTPIRRGIAFVAILGAVLGAACSRQPASSPPPAPAAPLAPQAAQFGPWVAEGLARHARDPVGHAALDLLRPTGPVPFDQLTALAAGSLESPAYERAVATVQLLAAYLEEQTGAATLAELQSEITRRSSNPEAPFRAWLQQRYPEDDQPVIPPDPMPWMLSYSHPAPKVRTRYKLSVALDPGAYSLAAVSQVRFTNNEAVPLDSLYFHLFPNAPYFDQGRRPSALTVSAVQVDGKPVPFTGGAEEILGLALPEPLAPGAALTVSLTWSATVPDIDDRYGVEGSTLLLGNFYPILAMHDQSGWHLDRYVDAGDPFYSEVADYDVTFTVPAGYQVAATGRADEHGLHFTAENVRDFAAAASPDFQVAVQTVDGVRVHYYRGKGVSLTTTPAAALSLAADALHFYSLTFGAYPYPDLTVVSAGLGMEYPQFVMAGSPVAIAHEVAHQWWYGVVGNDELRQIWDEGLTEYSSMWYLSVAGRSRGRPYASSDAAMDRTLYDYAGLPDQAGDYEATIYGRGWRLWAALRSKMGDTAFTGMLNDFYTQHKYGLATWDDWRQAVSQAGGKEALALFDAYVSRSGGPP